MEEKNGQVQQRSTRSQGLSVSTGPGALQGLREAAEGREFSGGCNKPG